MKKGEVISNNNVNYSLIESIGEGVSSVVWETQADKNIYAIKFIDPNDEKKKIDKKKIKNVSSG